MESLDALWQQLIARTDYERCERPRAARFRLDTIRDLCARLGDPQGKMTTLHIAGSKGKGTVCHYLARGLQAAGFRVGLYTSPHLSHWRERIRIDGDEVAEGIVREAIAAVLAVSQGEETFFDLLTAVAFQAFHLSGCEIQVIETGLGGRFDSTNVVQPLASAVVSLEHEHRDVLGDSLAAIASEKAGIYKEGAQAWAGPGIEPEAMAVLQQAARACGEALRIAPHGQDARFPLAVQRDDYALAHAMLAALPAPFTTAATALAALPLAALAVPGRMEWRRFADGRVALFDLAHTARSLAAVLAAFRAQTATPRAVLLALRDDKDALALAHAMEALGPRPEAESWYTLPAGDHPRSADPARIATAFGATALSAPELPAHPGPFLITGSTYLVGALRPASTPLDALPTAPSHDPST